MLFETNKQKGNCGLAAAIQYYTFKGYTISLPLNDTQDYDLIIDDGEKLLKVQVKATAQRDKSTGYSQVMVCSCGGTNGSVYKTVKDTNIDILFVLTELQEMYEIPIKDVTTSKSLNLGPSRQCYRIDNLSTEYVLKPQGRPKSQEFKNDELYCTNCGVLISKQNQHNLCIKCLNASRRVVERPTKEVLLKELQESNFTAVGRKYNVTDNTIRKWCKSYNLPIHTSEIKTFVL